MRPAPPIVPPGHERSTLESWCQDPSISPRLQLRARIVLKAAEGRTNQTIARELGVTPATVGLWRRRFAVHGLEGIRLLAPHSLQPYPLGLENEELILEATRAVPPPQGMRWTTRTLARYLGLNHMQVYRAWKKHTISAGLPVLPAPTDGPGAWVDIVGSFRCPPVSAVLFGIDETGTVVRHRSQTINGARGVAESTKVLYVPAPGTPELSWSLEELRRIVPERRFPVAGPHDLLIFLRSVERRWAPDLRFHLIAECPDRKMRDRLCQWLARRPPYSFRIVPDSAAWNAAVHRFLRSWDPRRLTRTSFRGVDRFAEALVRFAGRPSTPAVAFTWSLRE